MAAYRRLDPGRGPRQNLPSAINELIHVYLIVGHGLHPVGITQRIGLRFGMLVFLVSSILSAAASSSSSTCSTFRLDDPGGTMEHVAPYRQLFGICYTASGMDLIGAQNANLRHASPLAAAVEASTRLDEPVHEDPVKLDTYPFENGFSCDAINALRHRGFCSAEAMARAFPDGEDFAIDRMYADFKKDRAGYQKECATSGVARSVASLDRVMAKAYEKNAPLAYFQRRIAQVCPPSKRVAVDAPQCFERAIEGPDQFAAVIHEQFDHLGKRAQPIEIGYCNGVQNQGPSFRGVIQKGAVKPWARYNLCEGHDPNDRESDGAHSVTLIGRRLHQGTCQLLVKESSGAGCARDWLRHWECRDGKIWIDQDALAANVTSVSRLAKPFLPAKSRPAR